MTRLGDFRDRIVNRALGVELRGLQEGFQQSLSRLERLAEQQQAATEYIVRRMMAQVAAERVARDNIPALRKRLADIRASKAYEEARAEREPLVSVRIASYSKTDQLIDVALASVRAQTYERWEAVVVNDGPNPKTKAALAALGDPRIRYEEITRSVYPEQAHARWMSLAVRPYNRAIDLSNGTWVAPLDDDDEFTPDHIERLISLALTEQVELAYSALRQTNLVNGVETVIYSEPPQVSMFSLQSSVFLRVLHPTFKMDPQSWMVEEPADWNLTRRMLEAGVTMKGIPDVLGNVYQIPYTHKPDF